MISRFARSMWKVDVSGSELSVRSIPHCGNLSLSNYTTGAKGKEIDAE